MRQISPATNLVLACLAALGLVATLGLPWYAPPVPDTNEFDGPVERAAWAVANVFKHHPGAVTGSDVLGATRTMLLAAAAAVIVLSLLMFVAALRPYVRDVLRAVSLVSPLLVLYLMVDHPGNRELDIHWGIVAAAGVATFTATAAWHGSGIREKRAPAGSWEGRPARS